MHILLLSAYFPPDNGSAANLFWELGQAFIARGHQVSVVTGFPGYHAQADLSPYKRKLSYTERVAGITAYHVRVPEFARDTSIGRGLWQFSGALAFAMRGLRIPRPDIALVYSPPLPLGLTALLWRRSRHVPFVFNVQDLFPQSAVDLGLLRQHLLVRFFRWLEQVIYQRADALTVHSKGNRDYVVAHGAQRGRTTVVHNWVDVDQIRPAANGPDGASFGLAGRFVVSFAGVMGHSQDLDVILAAAQRLRDRVDIQFLLVGDGVEKQRAVQKGHALGLTNVTWLPMLSRVQYPAVLRASSIGLATLRANVRTPVVPSKILSIMAAGIPVVAAVDSAGDARHLLEDSQAGFWVEPSDARTLADRVLQLYLDADVRRIMGKNGRRYIEEHMAVGTIAEQYEQIFQTVIGYWRNA
jgi:colanic acid biosynthesis glycosyl transferase WcaI